MNAWLRRHPLLVNVLLIVLIVGPGYFRLEQTVAADHRQDETACEDRRNGRIILRELVELSDDGSGGFNLSGFDSFNDLDPAMQTYLRDVEEASKQAPRPSEFVDSALKLLVVPECP